VASSRLSLAAAGLAALACVTAILAGFLPAEGHPPLADYVRPIAVLIAWVFALFGVGFAIVSRRSVSRGRYLLALTANVAAIVAGFFIWFVWPFLRTA
jgi:hypothetical protein